MNAYEFPELTDEAAHYWLKMDTWKPYDAAWLLCGIDPHGMERRYGAFATELCTQMCGDHPVSKAAFQVVELLKASSKAGGISFPAAPSAVIAWAKPKQLKLPKQFLDAQFGGAAAVPGAKDGGDKATGGLVQRRIAVIVETARKLGYDPIKVAWGGKAATERECLKNPALFTPATFDTAWKAARKEGLVEVENVEIYRAR